MKSSKGVTTASLIIYVIAMLIVIGIIATITSFFYTNVMNVEDSSSNISEITKFNMYFLEETKNNDNSIIQVGQNFITFETGNIFTFQDNCIYLNNIRICENVKNFELNVEEVNNKEVINVLLTIGDNVEYTKTTKYVMSSNGKFR